MEIEIRTNVPKPEKKERFEFSKIKVGDGMFIWPTGKETLKSLAATVKSAVTKFKKTTPMDLSVYVREDLENGKPGILVRHNPPEVTE